MEFPANSMPAKPRRSEPASDLGRRAAKILLRAAFTGARGGDLEERAARYTGRSEKTVRNWLDGTHEMKLGDALSLVPLVGVETVLRIISRG